MGSFSNVVVLEEPPGSLLPRKKTTMGDYFQQTIEKTCSNEELEERVGRFEQWKAVTSASILEIGSAIIFVGAAYRNSENWKDWVGAAMWHGSLWTIPHLFVHRPKTLLNNVGFAASLGTLILQPHMAVCKRAPYIGSIHGSASVMVSIRALQYYLNQEEYKDWKPFRRMFFISAWGWHDFRHVKYVGPGKAVPELKRLAKWASLLAATVIFHLWWGKPANLVGQKLLTLKVLFYFLVRWSVGFWTLLSWFNCMDAFPRALHFWADGHELRHISEDPWGARTLKDFWGRRWNVPVQELLVKGVFKPISKMSWLPFRKEIAKLMVFVVSASGHTYAISCGGSPWRHLFAMYSFFMLQIPLIGIEDTFKMEGLTWMLGSEIPFSPLFIEPILTFCHL